ncbi:hypothetical protein ONZ45_g14534 [Pleurotus djamor]|nr:hypothetical protein ONZ45_g14534 [Pleurotus djamor]
MASTAIKLSGIRLVTFDLLHTLITPRLPIHQQYASVFEPYLGPLEPNAIKQSFKVALKETQKEYPSYVNGTHQWWGHVIKRTALDAGADPGRVDSSLDKIVPALLKRFSSKEGYKLFDDAIPTLEWLRATAHVKTAAISNADSRMRAVVHDLGLHHFLDCIVLSEEVKVEKPDSRIFTSVLNELGAHATKLKLQECLHIGDEVESDYYGPQRAGMKALLIRRPNHDNDRDELINQDIAVIRSLSELKAILRTGM